MGLLLEAVDVAGPLRWRWVLIDEETGGVVADHPVDLSSALDEVERFSGLFMYARWHAAPDRRIADESRIVAEAGAWAGHVLLGETVGTAIAAAAPVTVCVIAPPPADHVLLWPLELAHTDGRPLAARGDVTFVYDIGDVGRRKEPVGEVLRMLAVFSMPANTNVLAVRRERYEMERMIRRIVARESAAVELRVAQYGVTRERLREIADSDEGWDLLHISGHGGGGVFLLEKADGSPDPVSVDDMVDLLRPMRRRVKLAVMAYESAGRATAETLRLFGLAEQAEQAEAAAEKQSVAEIPGQTRTLARGLDCAVVAMRYPVTDAFVIAFADAFYEHLLIRRQPVDVALARARAEAAGTTPSPTRPPMSLVTPGIFGMRSAGLKLAAPRGQLRMDLADQRMAYFPDEPERFVGRAELLAKASAALAPASRYTGVLFHGLAGSGKSACALELAYRYREGFAAAAFWQAPAHEDEWAGALADFASKMDVQLGGYGFTMASHIGTAAALEAFLPRLRRVMADSGVLLVLDNLETLLTEEGGWRDPQWERLIVALTSHGGESRVLMTSRVAPTVDERVMALAVQALSLEEAAALARDLW